MADLEINGVVVPIFGLGASGETECFLGTGAFVDDPPLLLTADHVIRDWPGRLAVATLHDLNHCFVASIVARDQVHDLALLSVASYSPPRTLRLGFDRTIHANIPLMTHEYSSTAPQAARFILNPATRIGNATRILNLIDQMGLGQAGDAILELSFPALRGASGAPVFVNDSTFEVVGVIVSNASYHLLPCQIESVLDQKNELIEEIKFMLPQALAVNIKHLKPLLEEARRLHVA